MAPGSWFSFRVAPNNCGLVIVWLVGMVHLVHATTGFIQPKPIMASSPTPLPPVEGRTLGGAPLLISQVPLSVWPAASGGWHFSTLGSWLFFRGPDCSTSALWGPSRNTPSQDAAAVPLYHMPSSWSAPRPTNCRTLPSLGSSHGTPVYKNERLGHKHVGQLSIQLSLSRGGVGQIRLGWAGSLCSDRSAMHTNATKEIFLVVGANGKLDDALHAAS